MPYSDNEAWLVDTGAEIIERRSLLGPSSLGPIEQLVYCLWILDYAMRNAGDLSNAFELRPSFMTEAKVLAEELRLQRMTEAFSLSVRDLEARYFPMFDTLVGELRAVHKSLVDPPQR